MTADFCSHRAKNAHTLTSAVAEDFLYPPIPISVIFISWEEDGTNKRGEHGQLAFSLGALKYMKLYLKLTDNNNLAGREKW